MADISGASNVEFMPFIRQAELLIGPLREDQGGGPVNQALRIFSDGSRNNLRMTFSVSKSMLSTPNASNVQIYNLSRENQQRIRSSLARVRLSVGHRNTGMRLLARGALLASYTEKQGPDYITHINFLDGFAGQMQGVSNTTFGPGLSVEAIIRQLAADMPGVQIGRIQVNGAIGHGGLTVSDRSSVALSKLAEQYGFSWSIQDGVFQALDDRAGFSSVSRISYKNRNLIKATPILDSALQEETGVEIMTILDAGIIPGNMILLESQANPELDGTYKIHEATYDGDLYDSTFETNITSYKLI